MSALTSNKSVLSWIDEKVELVKPDKIVWIDGSKEQIEELRLKSSEQLLVQQANSSSSIRSFFLIATFTEQL